MMTDNPFTEGVIETEPGPILVRDFSYFLYHFRAVYVEALIYKHQHQIYDLPRESAIAQIADEIASSLAKKGRLGVPKNALVNLPTEEELAIENIFRRNPLDIVFSGVGVALAAAVIISGGEIKWDKDGFKVKLPPLGKGIAEIKKAIYGNKKPKAQRRPENKNKKSSR